MRDAECHEWLSKYLAEGDDCQRPATDVRTTGLGLGYGWETIRRAKVELEVEHVRIGVKGRTGGGYWTWRLPDEHPLRMPADEPDEATVGG